MPKAAIRLAETTWPVVGYFDYGEGQVSNFIQTPIGQRAHPSQIMEGAMHDSRRYRDSAAECLLAAEEACQPYYRKLHLSMAASWLLLARQDEAIDNLFARWDTDKPIREPAAGRH